MSRINRFKTQPREEFEMKGLRTAKKILDVKNHKDRGSGKWYLL